MDAAGWLVGHAPGPTALFIAPETAEEFLSLEIAGPDENSIGSVVIGDYGERWSFGELNRAFRLLMNSPQPCLVALGMTRPDDLGGDVRPEFVLDSIAELPQPWMEVEGAVQTA